MKSELVLTKEQRKTYCPRLWKESFIFEDGNVFACCHEKPKPLGNIYNETLEEIYNGEAMQKARAKSLSGKLSCYKSCNLLKEEEFENPITDLVAPYDSLNRLKIQFGQDCNINCIMCYQVKNKRGNPSISSDVLKENVNLSPFNVVDMQGGEPLFIQSARTYVDHVIEKGKKVSLLTNGTVMNKTWARKVVENSPEYYVSINASTKETHEIVNKGSKWEQVIKNISLLRSMREELGGNLLIKGHFTIIMTNCHEVPSFIKKFKSLGFDTIDFGYDFRFPYKLALKPGFKKKLKKEIKEAFAQSPDQSDINALRLKHLKFV